MKFAAFGLAAISLLHGASAKKYYNREIEQDKTGLLGRKAHHIYESAVEDPHETNVPNEGRGLKGKVHGRRVEGEVPMPPPADDDDEFPPTQFQQKQIQKQKQLFILIQKPTNLHRK